jgi:uridine kinase
MYLSGVSISAMNGTDRKEPSAVKTNRLVRRGAPRKWVQARLADGRIYEAPPRTPLAEIFRVAGSSSPTPVVAAIINGRLRELTTPLQADSDVVPITLSHADGVRIYRRSLSFLLLTAISETFPNAEIFIEHSATTAGAYFCEVHGRGPFKQEELAVIEARMREIVAEDAPIIPSEVRQEEAIELFRARGEEDKARLIEHRKKDTLTLYTLRGRPDYFMGFMVPSTGCLKYFALHTFHPGFMLQFPHQSRPTEITLIPPYPKLFGVFEEAGHWLNRMGIRSAGALNDAIVEGRLAEISLVAEAFHEARIVEIAADIAALRNRIRVVLIAGPSSSGKTTFSKRLAVQLLANGLRPFPMSLDDYFVERERTPRDERNELNYETIAALDLPLFNQHLAELIEGRETQLPRYDFTSGHRVPGPTVTLNRDDLVIVEGIHGLNPELISGQPGEKIYRVYVSALTQLNLDRHNRINTTDSRLIRRIVRDAATRGYNATDTLKRWDSVVAGEKQNIFPFQEYSDAIFNSALVHELAILRPYAEPLLLQVRPDSPQHLEANRLLALLQWFRPAPPDSVPNNSILREFIGDSVLESFRLWN